MNTDYRAFANLHLEGESATRPLARLGRRLALSLRLAGMSLPRCREKAPGRPKLSRSPLGGRERRIAASPGGRVRRARHSPRRTIGRVQLPFLG
jgi:hypothetical protein